MGLISPNIDCMNRMNLFPVFFTPRKDPEAMVYSGMTCHIFGTIVYGVVEHWMGLMDPQ